MSRRNAPMSPLSMDSNDSSFVSHYNNMGAGKMGHSMGGSMGGSVGGTPNDVPYAGGPYGAARPAQTSPPGSSHPSGSTDMSRPSASSGSQRPPSSASSIGGRSDGRMGFGGRGPASRDSGRSTFRPDHEDALQKHYQVLKGYLASHLRDEKGNLKPNRARDKLLRLSVTQFMELSTDVYDELIRREDQRLQRVREVPPFLPPKQNYHPKRNQARQKLSTLPLERFRQLATDVFFELERRIPRFAGDDIDRPISSTSNGRAPSRGGMRAPPPPGFRGPPPPGGPPGRPPMGANGMGPPQPSYNSFRPNSPGPSGAPPGGPGTRRPSEAGSLGRPLPKTFQSNTIVPNKSTMVEDDDDDDEEGEDSFALDKVVSGMSNIRLSEMTSSVMGGLGSDKDREMIRSQEAEIATLKEKMDGLENRLMEKESEIEATKQSGREREDGAAAERNEWFTLREELEQKVMDAQRLQNDVRNELEMLRRDKKASEKEVNAQHAREVSDLQTQVEAAQDQEEDLRRLLENLRHQNGDLKHQLDLQQAELAELRQQTHSSSGRKEGDQDQDHRLQLLEEELATQEKLADEVRQEATVYLREMRELSRQNDTAIEAEEKLAAQVAKLEGENEAWRQRYARLKAQNKSLRASTMGLPLNLQTSFDSSSGSNFLRNGSSSNNNQQNGVVSQDGLVKDVDVTRFQLAIDDLLRAARQPATDPMLEGVKQVALAVQAIASHIGTDGYPTPTPSPHSPGNHNNNHTNNPSVAKLKARVTGTANSLITATKQHASAAGLSPVALLDAAASNLTASVVELVKAVGIRPSGKEELHDAEADADADADMLAFYDDALTPEHESGNGTLNALSFSVPQLQQGKGQGQAKPAPLNIGRSASAAGATSTNAAATKKTNGWFAGWARSNSMDSDAPPTPTLVTSGYKQEEEEYDPYR